MMEFCVGCWVQQSCGWGWCTPRLVREENQQVPGSNPRRSVCVSLGVLLVLGGGVAQLSCKLTAILLHLSQELDREACATILGSISDILAYLFLPPTALMAQYLLQNEVTEVNPQTQPALSWMSCPVMDVPGGRAESLNKTGLTHPPQSICNSVFLPWRVNPHLALHLTSPSPPETRDPILCLHLRTCSTTLPSASIASPNYIGVSTDGSVTG